MTTNPRSPSTPRRASRFSQRLRERTWAAHGDAETIGVHAGAARRPRCRRVVRRDGGAARLVYEVIESAGVAMRDDPAAGALRVRRARPAAIAFSEDIDVPARRRRPRRDRAAARDAAVHRPAAGRVLHVAGGLRRASLHAVHGRPVRRADDPRRARTRVRLRGRRRAEEPHLRARSTDRNAFRDEYRARLDAMELSDDEQARMIDEILLAYRLNTAVIARHGRDVRPAARGLNGCARRPSRPPAVAAARARCGCAHRRRLDTRAPRRRRREELVHRARARRVAVDVHAPSSSAAKPALPTTVTDVTGEAGHGHEREPDPGARHLRHARRARSTRSVSATGSSGATCRPASPRCGTCPLVTHNGHELNAEAILDLHPSVDAHRLQHRSARGAAAAEGRRHPGRDHGRQPLARR